MSRFIQLFIFCLLCLLNSSWVVYAQKDSLSNLYIPEIENLLKKKAEDEELSVTIATGSETSLEEAPSIISVITERDILHYGCRDLTDILRLVPGFEYGIDVLSLFGLGFRGIWAHEGKALLTINGQPINCYGYGNYNFFGVVPAAMIERVEIIRGPGGAIYGGFAEVAVVNVITKRTKGVLIETHGALQGKDIAFGGNISVGYTNNNDKEVFVNIGQQNWPLSTRTYADYYGTSYQMGTKNSYKQWQHINIKARLKNFDLAYNRVLLYHNALDYYTAIPNFSNGTYQENELSNYNDNYFAKYKIPLSSKTTLTPSFECGIGNAISTSSAPLLFFDSAKKELVVFDVSNYWQNAKARSTKLQPQLNLNYIIPKGEIVIGAGLQVNSTRSRGISGEPGLQLSSNVADTASRVTKVSRYAFMQVNKQIGFIGFNLGIRSEVTPFGDALAPRIGFTYYQKGWNAKFLYGYAYRIPLIWQAYSRQFSASNMVPEISNTLEIEIGRRFSKRLSARANAFYINIDRPITYIGRNNSYQNFGRVQSLGLEAEANARFDKGGGFFNLSYCQPGTKTSPDFISANRRNFLALPGTKVNFGGYITLKKWLSFSSNMTIIGPRHAQSLRSALESTVSSTIFETTKHDARYMLSATVNAELLKKRLLVKLLVSNLLNQPYMVYQPYYGGHAPMPLDDRYVGFELAYRFE